MQRLDESAIRALAATLPDWRVDPARGGTLRREFVFDGFAEAFAFMTELAFAAEKHDHHPDWSNVHRRVVVALTTHDANGLTAKDVALAQVADAIYARRRAGA